MLSVGAYSKKFQNLEKERLMQLKEREKVKRGKAQLYSKQTAQRQKALEEKKRAMAIAEEDRRRKALEERRDSQKEATKRFKSALGRIRATSKGQVQPISKDRTTSIDFYLPDKANPKNRSSTSSQLQLNRPSNDEHQERVAFGKEVELKIKPKNGFHHPPHINGLQQRTPSLDDVLRQIKGERNPSTDGGAQYSQGRIHVHQTVPGMFGTTQQHKQLSSLGGPGRSASDPSLNVTASNHQRKQPTPPLQSATYQDSVAGNKQSDALYSQATHNLHRNASNENIVFRRIEANQQPHPSVSKMEEDLHVMSPETLDSSSSGLPSDSSSDGLVSPDLNDSLEFSKPGVTFTVGNTQLRSTQNKTNQLAGKDSSNENLSGSKESMINNDSSTHFDSNSLNTRTSSSQGNEQLAKGQQSMYIYEVDDSSSNDSMEEYRARAGLRPTPPRDRRHRKHQSCVPYTVSSDNPIENFAHIASMPTNTSTELSITQHQSQSSVRADSIDLDVEVKPKPKIVGILKKSGSSGSNSRVPSSSNMAGSNYANSTVEGQSGEALTGAGHDYCDGNTQTEYKKKVRFVDQLSGPVKKNAVKPEIGFIDSARLELWKRVLPNAVSTHYLSNSAFTPKMKVSLLSKASTSQGISGPPMKSHPPHPPNGIAVHVPVASADESPGASPSPRQITQVQSIPEELPSKVPDPTSEKLPVNSSSSGERLPDTTQATTEPLQSDATNGDIDPSKLQVTKQIALDKTPTDDDINNLWDQIRNALQDNQKIAVPPQVFNFRIQPDKHNYQPFDNSSAGSVSSQTSTLPLRDDQRALSGTSRRNPTAERTHPNAPVPQRQGYLRQTNTSRTMRCQQNSPHQQTQLLGRRGHSYTATYPAANRQDHSLFSTRTHPSVQTSSVEPELVVKATGNNFGRKTPTALSLEEQRLMLSIETLNQQIKDHMARPPGVSQFESPKSPDPPDFTPEYYPHPPPSPTPPQRHRSISTHPHNHPHSYGTVSGRSRGYSDLPKTRVRRNPQTVAQAATVNAQLANSSRTHGKVPTYRQPLYN